jgi:nicotinamide phosphoribosyltransferase
MNQNNILFYTDGYKPSHRNQEIPGSTQKYYYMENRSNAVYPYSIFYGLQAVLKEFFLGEQLTKDKIEEADDFYGTYFGKKGVFPKEEFLRVMEKYQGRLPLEIKAIPEGTLVNKGNVLFTVESADRNISNGFIAGYLEPLLMHFWYPTAVATKSFHTRTIIEKVARITGEEGSCFDFHVHEFGYRGATCSAAAMIGASAHLTVYKGTDTILGIMGAQKFYNADPKNVGFSIPASEHSIMTQLGKDGEMDVLFHLLETYNDGIVAFPVDSFDAIEMITKGAERIKSTILQNYERTNGNFKVVFRLDSPRCKGDTPEEQVLWAHKELARIYGATENHKGFTSLHPAIGILYGDGLTTEDIGRIYNTLAANKFCIESFCVGQGGGLLQKVSRDTQSTAYKLSKQVLNGKDITVQKIPLDISKASKPGRLKLFKEIQPNGEVVLTTMSDSHPLYNDVHCEMVPVFRNGELLVDYSFDEIRERVKSNLLNFK